MYIPSRISFPWVGILVLSGLPLFAQEAPKKASVPDATALAEATKLVKEIYGDEWASAKTPAEKQALAKKLLQKAKETNDDQPGRFVLFRLSRDIATQANDGETAFQAIDEMERSFQIDALEMKATVLNKLVGITKTLEQHKSLAERAITLLDGAVSKDAFAVVEQVGTLALDEAKKARDKTLIKQASERAAEIGELTKSYEAVKKAMAALEKTPDDTEANLTVGKYKCFAKGDWESGLPMLALGNDQALKALAAKDLEGTVLSDDQVKLGDGWWSLAETQDGTTKKQVQGRVAFWYRKAVPGLTGFVKDKVEKRLEAMGGISTTDIAAHRDTSQFGDKLVSAALHWLARHQLSDGRWSLQDYRSRCSDQTCTGPGKAVADAGATALGLLPFLAAGHTHKTPGPYRANILGGVNWLIRHQKPDGDLAFGHAQKMYSHGLATIALCKAYGLSRDRNIKMAAQAAVNYIVAAQHKTTGGWRYNPGEAGDTCVLGWQLTALKNAESAGLRVNSATFSGATRWLDSCAKGRNASEYCYEPSAGPSDTMTAVGLRSRQYLGVKRDSPMMLDGAKYLMDHMANASVPNVYYWYYASQVVHSISGDEWDTWNRNVRKLLLDSQNKESGSCANGSWSPESDQWGSHGGRIMMTSLATLIFEIGSAQSPVHK